MKKLFVIILCTIGAFQINAQDTTEQKVVETKFWVDGVCEMCKDRIESAVMRTKGVKLANWDVKSHELTVVYKASKVSEEELHTAVNMVGHDTKKQKAEDEVYDKIHPCCHYRDEKVRDDH